MSLPSPDTRIADCEDAPPPQSRLASHPFDKPCGDVVLRTCDHVEFRVRSHILVEASLVFEAMFSLPQPQTGGDSSGQPPVVDLVEDSDTIDTLLRICYPIKNPALVQPLDKLESALRAAMKYDMELPIDVLTDRVLSLAEQMPLEVWVLSSRLALETVARCAAQHLLAMVSLDFSSLGTMDGICAGDYFRLREFHRTGVPIDVQTSLLSPPACLCAPRLEEPLPASWPAEPFPDDRPPNLICRSADGVDFDAHKEVLSALSGRLLTDIAAAGGVGDAQATNGGAQTGASGTKPVIHINAQAAVLVQLLRLCYSRRANPWICDPDMVADLTLTVEEYQLDTISHAVEKLWTLVISADSLRAYFAAATRGLREHAAQAAKATLHMSLDGVYIHELEGIPALFYHRLLTYHASCRTAATTALHRSFPVSELPVDDEGFTSVVGATAPTFPPPSEPVTLPRENSSCGHLHTGFKSGKRWFSDYVASVCLQVRQNPYSTSRDPISVLSEAIAAKLWCRSCQKITRDLSKVCESLRQIPLDVSNVAFEL